MVINDLVSIFFNGLTYLVIFLVNSDIPLTIPVLLFIVVIRTGQTVFSLGRHVVNIVWSQEMVVEPLKTLPTIMRLSVCDVIGTGFYGDKNGF